MDVRLLHAQVRYFIKNAVKWDTDYRGVPINQEDMLATVTLFSSAMIDGSQVFMTHTTQQEKEAVCHLWRCIGYYIGIFNSFVTP